MIRWVTEQLGISAWGHVGADKDIQAVDVRDLVDKEGNAPAMVRAKIDEVLSHLQQGRRVAVCCDYGISRSAALVAGILVIHERVTLEEAVRRVMTATGETAIKIEVLGAVRRALGLDKDGLPVPRKTEGRRVLVTGASGFIGSSVVRELERKHEVVAPTRLEIDLSSDAIPLDLLVKRRGIDTVLHLANSRIYTTNESMGGALVMLKNVLDVCAENELFLIYLSGWEIYSGYKTKELRASESLAPRPGGTYGQTKFLCETLIEQYQRYHPISFTILRSSPVYGPGADRPKFIWNFLEKASQNKPIVTHKYINGFPMVDLLHIADITRAIVAAIERRVPGTINLGTGVGTFVHDVARLIIELVGSRSQIAHIEIESYVGNVVMDITRAMDVLGWRPTIALRQGLQTVVTGSLSRRP